MANNKLSKLKKKDHEWQEKITQNLYKDKVQLDHPQGLERFKRVIRTIGKEPQ